VDGRGESGEEGAGVSKPAKQIVHWPGQDTAACEDHLQKLVGLAAVLGFQLSWTPCEEMVCANCANEASKSA
jgi:hypothetical protein